MAVASPIHGSRVALLGTSLVQQNHKAGERYICSSARGWATWAEVLSHGHLDIHVIHDPLVYPGWEPSGRAGDTRGFSGLNAGVSGQKARDIANRIDDVLALDFDLIIVDAGTNDMLVETKEVIQAIRENIASRLLDAGKVVILLPILARGTEKWPAAGPERAKAHWINHMSRAFAARNSRCHIFDWNGPWVDWRSADGVPHSGFSDDGTHFSVPGAYAVGKALAGYLTGFLPPRLQQQWARDDRFDAIENPLGNIIPASVARSSAITADRSPQADNDEASTGTASGTRHLPDWHEVRLEGGSRRVELVNSTLINPLPAGAWIQATCLVEIDAHDGWRDVSLVLADKAPEGLTAQALAPFDLADRSPAPFPKESWSGKLRTPPMRLKAPRNGLSLMLSLNVLSSNEPAVLRFSALTLRQVDSPIPK
jgi:lysophospholipase L1-like esterase